MVYNISSVQLIPLFSHLNTTSVLLGAFFVKVVCSKLSFPKISLMSLKTETGIPHATERSKDIRSVRRETSEKQLTPLKTKSSLPFSTDFAKQAGQSNSNIRAHL